MKRRTTIYLNEEVYQMAKKEIVNLSAFIEETLKTHMFSDLNLLRSRITNLEKDLKLKKDVYRQLTLVGFDSEKYQGELVRSIFDLVKISPQMPDTKIRQGIRGKITGKFKSWTESEIDKMITDVWREYVNLKARKVEVLDHASK